MSIIDKIWVSLWVLFGLLMILRGWSKSQSPAPNKTDDPLRTGLVAFICATIAMALLCHRGYYIPALLLSITWTIEWIAEMMWVRRMREEGGWIKTSPFVPYRYGIGKDGVPLLGDFLVGHFVPAKVMERMTLGDTGGANADVRILFRADADTTPQNFYRTISDLKIELWNRYDGNMTLWRAERMPSVGCSTPLDGVEIVFNYIKYYPAPIKII